MKHQLVSFSTQILHKNLILHDSAEMSFSNLSCMFLNPNIFFQFEF